MRLVDGSSATTSPARRRTLVLGLVATTLVGLLGWIVPAHRARAAVEVLPRAMHCGPDDVPFRILDQGAEARPAFDVTLRPKSFCQLTVTVVNHGSRTVHLDTAAFPDMAPGEAAGGPLEITRNGGRFTARDAGSTEEGEARIPLDVELAPDESTETIFDLRTRRSAFLGQPGRYIGYGSLPVVHLTSLRIPGTVRGSVGLWIHEQK
jgi:hypothetical protein